MKDAKYALMSVVVLCMSISGCTDENETSTGRGEWLISRSNVISGGPGKDGIPAIDNPKKIDVESVDFLDDDDLVIGIKKGNNVVAYPHKILDWHEIVNDIIDDEAVAIVYCPLTGTGIGWDRTINGTETSFGVSGLLYNNNIIPYDRLTDSYWTQLMGQCVNGELIGETPSTYSLVETTWGHWKTIYPYSEIISTNTGYSRTYGTYPYGGYKENHDFLLFPLTVDDDRLPRKERVHGIIDGESVKVYQFSNFPDEVTLIEDTFLSTDYLIVGSTSRNFIVSFQKLDDLIFSANIGESDVILVDNEGNKWDIFGYAVEGPRTGSQLVTSTSMIGYWFGWGAFYSDCHIYN